MGCMCSQSESKKSVSAREKHSRYESQQTFQQYSPIEVPKIQPNGIKDKRYRILVLGDYKTGKTQLLNRIETGKFSEIYYATQSYGPVAAVKTIDNDPGKAKTKLIFQEFAINNIDKLKQNIFEKIQVVFLLYTSSESLQTLLQQYQQIQPRIAEQKISCFLIYNQIQSDDQPIQNIQNLENLGRKGAYKFNLFFIKINIKENLNIDQLEEKLIKKLNYNDEANTSISVISQNTQLTI